MKIGSDSSLRGRTGHTKEKMNLCQLTKAPPTINDLQNPWGPKTKIQQPSFKPITSESPDLSSLVN